MSLARSALTAALLIGLGLGPTAVVAQPGPGRPRPGPPPPASQLQRSTLQDQPFPGGRNHTVLIRTTIARGGEAAPHTHPGLEMAYILEGDAMLRMAGEPDRRLRSGDSFAAPPGTVHSVRNLSFARPLTIVSTYVVDRNQPLASPARMPPR
jgi:quercetin dioxygenase-like cupin family protein